NKGTTDDSAYSLGAAVLASLCLREDCSSLLSGSFMYQLTGSNDATAHVLVYGGSLVHRVSSHVKLLAEVTSAGVAAGGATNGYDNISGFLLSYGVRFHGTNFASDVGFVKPISNSATDGGLLTGLPFINVSY